MLRDVTEALKPKKVEYNHGVSLKVAKAIFGIGSAELAREFGVTPSAIDKWCRTKKWNKERLQAVADFFGMWPDSFEDLANRALSESVQGDCNALIEHLVEHHPNNGKQAAQIRRYYNKIIDLLTKIEGSK